MLNRNDFDGYQTAWQLCDWSHFSEILDLEASDDSSHNQTLALMLAGAALQVESKELARQLMTKALSLSSSALVKRFFFLSIRPNWGVLPLWRISTDRLCCIFKVPLPKVGN